MNLLNEDQYIDPIYISRDILSAKFHKNVLAYYLFTILAFESGHKDYRLNEETIKQGTVIAPLSFLSRIVGVDIPKVLRLLKTLKNEGITGYTKTGNTYKITMLKYVKYSEKDIG